MRVIGFVEENPENKKYMLDAATLRGHIINGMTYLERTIDTFISCHFCSDIIKADELIKCVFSSKYITFESKRSIFKNLLETHHKEYKKNNIDNIHADLDKFNEHRNNVAHFLLDLKPEALERYKNKKEITFLKFQNSLENKIYSFQTAIDIHNQMAACIKPIFDIIKVYKKTTPT